MVKLKLTLKSNKPSNVYALNGKSYRLQPGSNTLVLEYNDYVSLAKALGIKPVEKDEAPAAKKEEPKTTAPTEETKKEEPTHVEEHKHEEEPVKDEHESVKDEPAHEAEESAKEETPVEEPAKEEAPAEEKEDIDYSTWSLSKLKVEYKRITGNTCKLKKAEVIQFLQEHNSNV